MIDRWPRISAVSSNNKFIFLFLVPRSPHSHRPRDLVDLSLSCLHDFFAISWNNIGCKKKKKMNNKRISRPARTVEEKIRRPAEDASAEHGAAVKKPKLQQNAAGDDRLWVFVFWQSKNSNVALIYIYFCLKLSFQHTYYVWWDIKSSGEFVHLPLFIEGSRHF